MSFEEDYLMRKVRELEGRVSALEKELGWDGSTFSKSTEAQPTSTSNSEVSPPPPAQTTASPSKKGQTDSSTADSTVGSGMESPSEVTAPADNATKKEWVAFVNENGWDEGESGRAIEYTKQDLINWWYDEER